MLLAVPHKNQLKNNCNILYSYPFSWRSRSTGDRRRSASLSVGMSLPSISPTVFLYPSLLLLPRSERRSSPYAPLLIQTRSPLSLDVDILGLRLPIRNLSFSVVPEDLLYLFYLFIYWFYPDWNVGLVWSQLGQTNVCVWIWSCFALWLVICGFLSAQVDFGGYSYKKIWNAVNPLVIGKVVLKFASSNFLPIGDCL